MTTPLASRRNAALRRRHRGHLRSPGAARRARDRRVRRSPSTTPAGMRISGWPPRSVPSFVRWGVPWYRIQPEPNRWDWRWLDSRHGPLLRAGPSTRSSISCTTARRCGWIGSSTQPDYPERVAEYSVRVAERYADRVTDYTPVNEPMIHALFSGEYAYWPPYLSGEARAAAHGRSTRPRLCARPARHARGPRRCRHLRARGCRDAVRRRPRCAGAPRARATASRTRSSSLRTWSPGESTTRTRCARFFDAAESATPSSPGSRRTPCSLTCMGVNYYPRHSTEVLRSRASTTRADSPIRVRRATTA